MAIVLKKEMAIEWQEGVNYNEQTPEVQSYVENFFCCREPDVQVPISADDERIAYMEWLYPADGFKVRLNLTYPWQFPRNMQADRDLSNPVEITVIPVV